MKKLIVSILLLFTSFYFFANDNKIVGFDIGLCTGIPVYGSSYIRDYNSDVADGDSGRVIVGSVADISFRILDPLKIMLGSDVLCDFIWSGSENHSNHIDYSGWFGIKFYPGLGGLNSSVSYVLGRRTDFLGNGIDDAVVKSSSWGNGFRFSVEYDFLYDSSHKCMPAVGGYYRCMPRGGDTWDNVFAVYVTLGF